MSPVGPRHALGGPLSESVQGRGVGGSTSVPGGTELARREPGGIREETEGEGMRESGGKRGSTEGPGSGGRQTPSAQRALPGRLNPEQTAQASR